MAAALPKRFPMLRRYLARWAPRIFGRSLRDANTWAVFGGALFAAALGVSGYSMTQTDNPWSSVAYWIVTFILAFGLFAAIRMITVPFEIFKEDQSALDGFKRRATLIATFSIPEMLRPPGNPLRLTAIISNNGPADIVLRDLRLAVIEFSEPGAKSSADFQQTMKSIALHGIVQRHGFMPPNIPIALGDSGKFCRHVPLLSVEIDGAATTHTIKIAAGGSVAAVFEFAATQIDKDRNVRITLLDMEILVPGDSARAVLCPISSETDITSHGGVGRLVTPLARLPMALLPEDGELCLPLTT